MYTKQDNTATLHVGLQDPEQPSPAAKRHAELMRDYVATGLPPAYLPQPQRDEDPDQETE